LRYSVVATGAADSYSNSGNAVTISGLTTTVEDNLFLNSLNPAAEPNLLLVQNEAAGGVAAINRNTFTHTGATSNVDTIRLAGRFTTATVGHNTITRGGDAVQILGSNSVGTYATLTVTNNTIVDAGRDGVVVGGTTAATYVNIQAGSIDHNAITGGGTAGTSFAAIRIPSGNTIAVTPIFKINDNDLSNQATGNLGLVSAVSVDAKDNWWGTYKGPTHSGNSGGDGSSISGNVVYGDYEPWIGKLPNLPVVEGTAVIEPVTPEWLFEAIVADAGDNQEEVKTTPMSRASSLWSRRFLPRMTRWSLDWRWTTVPMLV
jgi:hypothetical protein